MAEFYANYPNIQYVAISEFQRQVEKLPGMKTIHHGIDLLDYTLRKKKQRYLAFLGRLAPMKGTHLAIQIAQKARIPLKIAGEIQPMYREYYEREVKPHIDGNFIEYIGEVNLKEKNELLGNALAMLFPIQWNEPFGLVTIESMACGTPVLAMPGGSVGELVENGVSGFVASSVDELAGYATQLETLIKPELVRGYVERNFTVEKMTAHYEDLYKSIVSEKSVDAVSRLFETSDQEASAA